MTLRSCARPSDTKGEKERERADRSDDRPTLNSNTGERDFGRSVACHTNTHHFSISTLHFPSNIQVDEAALACRQRPDRQKQIFDNERELQPMTAAAMTTTVIHTLELVQAKPSHRRCHSIGNGPA